LSADLSAACVDGRAVRWELVISRDVALGPAEACQYWSTAMSCKVATIRHQAARAGSFLDYQGADLLVVGPD
jgi:hypothetical protein